MFTGAGILSRAAYRASRWRHRPAGRREVYGQVRDGFGLTATATLVFLALAGEPRAGRHEAPPQRWAGCWADRAPGSRRSAASSASRRRREDRGPDHGAGPPPHRGPAGRARVPLRRRARPGLLRHPDRAEDPCGAAEVPAPATMETWVTSQTAIRCSWWWPSRRTRSWRLRRLLPDLRGIVGGRRVTVCFDRGGWSGMSADITAAGFDLLTWRKGPAPDHRPPGCSPPSLAPMTGAGPTSTSSPTPSRNWASAGPAGRR